MKYTTHLHPKNGRISRPIPHFFLHVFVMCKTFRLNRVPSGTKEPSMSQFWVSGGANFTNRS
jgi:hypothetical protein